MIDRTFCGTSSRYLLHVIAREESSLSVQFSFPPVSSLVQNGNDVVELESQLCFILALKWEKRTGLGSSTRGGGSCWSGSRRISGHGRSNRNGSNGSGGGIGRNRRISSGSRGIRTSSSGRICSRGRSASGGTTLLNLLLRLLRLLERGPSYHCGRMRGCRGSIIGDYLQIVVVTTSVDVCKLRLQRSQHPERIVQVLGLPIEDLDGEGMW